MEELRLSLGSLAHIRKQCLDMALSIINEKGAADRSSLGICGVQDMKVQIIDCAKSFTNFILEGASCESLVGKTPLLLSATRLLRDRNMCLSARAFNEIMCVKGYLRQQTPISPYTLTNKGLEYGENKPKPFEDSTNPYYYDNKFNDLLKELGLDGIVNRKSETPAQKKSVKKSKEA